MSVELCLVISVQKGQLLQQTNHIQLSISHGRLAGLGINQTLPPHRNHGYTTMPPHMSHRAHEPVGCAPLGPQNVKAVTAQHGNWQACYKPFPGKRPEYVLIP